MVLHKGASVYDESFHAGLNIIRGQNSSGKSTIVDFIFFALGGDFANWRPESERCEMVLAEVEINKQIITLRRGVSPNKGQGMDIFFGNLSDALASPFSDWQTYPAAKTVNKESFSQVLFRLLGFPEVTGNKGSNISMHQILRLTCVDQLSRVQSLFRDEAFDSSLTRKTVGDLLLGIYDDQLYSDQLSHRRVLQQLDQEKVEFSGLEAALKNVGQFDVLAKIPELISETEKELEIVRHTLAQGLPPIELAPPQEAATAALHQAQSAFTDRKYLYAQTAGNANMLAHELEDSGAFIENLQKRLTALQESVRAEQALGHLALQLCPECLQPLSPNTPAGHCHLCQQVAPESGRQNRILKLQNELSNQIDESKRLLVKREKDLEVARRALIQLDTEIAAAQRRLDDIVEATRTSRDRRLDELFVKKGALESHLAALFEQRKLAIRLNDLRNSITKLQRDIVDLNEAIRAGKQRQDTRRIEALSAIERYTLEFLKRDLNREPEFQVAQKVEIDFEKNECRIDGRSNFSASSMSYLKGAVHFALFFASLELNFFRFPKFIINDNIEDKGMEEVRSRNFQKVIAEISGRFDVEHQVIIATSMVAPELDNPTYCIGSKYSETNMTLKFPPNECGIPAPDA